MQSNFPPGATNGKLFESLSKHYKLNNDGADLDIALLKALPRYLKKLSKEEPKRFGKNEKTNQWRCARVRSYLVVSTLGRNQKVVDARVFKKGEAAREEMKQKKAEERPKKRAESDRRRRAKQGASTGTGQGVKRSPLFQWGYTEMKNVALGLSLRQMFIIGAIAAHIYAVEAKVAIGPKALGVVSLSTL